MTGIDRTPPKAAAEAGEKGLALRREHGRGGTDAGVARARDLKNRDHLSRDTIQRMRSYVRRHAADRKGRRRRARLGRGKGGRAGPLGDQAKPFGQPAEARLLQGARKLRR